jgi:hypothetical protein
MSNDTYKVNGNDLYKVSVILGDESEEIVRGTLDQVRVHLGEMHRSADQERLAQQGRVAEIKTAIRIYDGAAREFNRTRDHYKNAEAQYSREMSIAELHAHARNVERVRDGWHKAYDRVIAAVERLDSYDAEELRAADSRIAVVPRYAA